MHYYVSGSHRAKFDDDDFNSFRGIACERQTHTHTHTHTRLSSLKFALKTKRILSLPWGVLNFCIHITPLWVCHQIRREMTMALSNRYSGMAQLLEMGFLEVGKLLCNAQSTVLVISEQNTFI